ncbi:cyclin dependent kinase inhibitor 1Ca [Myripristis murdjan]|uniref:Cyclin-dependent kinase inhibitor 1B-like n=1 Tax=Myripristis murdjan TaxID=586833 RepID=A0A667ZQR0_9TELE|nr:cyclin-dependent kinase inhibitor 1B-like [Myripristis murdjan]XP_029904284.1 cyclin-dependent kinase inhibitor 1B-like [Myripristis murdjan]
MSPIRRKEAACRSLFGPVDHDLLSRELTQRLQEISEQDSRRWNFSFLTDTPLPGRYEWEEVPAGCSPALYRESAGGEDVAVASNPEESGCSGRLHLGPESPAPSPDTNQENCPSISNTLKRHPAEVTPIRRKRTLSKHKAPNNTHITDFFVKRKRTSESKVIQIPALTASSEATLCKRIR